MAPKFKIGDMVYRVRNGQEKIQQTCPICFGKLSVKIILGNDDEVIAPCGMCGNGPEGPRGYVQEYEYVAGAKPFFINCIRSSATPEGEIHEYTSSDHSCERENELFLTKDEAMVAAVEKKAEQETEQKRRADWIKHDKLKNYSWNAGYHLNLVKKAQRDIEYHGKLAGLCKAKDKSKEAE